jgi:hypothetical protein
MPFSLALTTMVYRRPVWAAWLPSRIANSTLYTAGSAVFS